MGYLPLNAIPYVARVDAGTFELVRAFNIEVVTSADLAQRFIAQLTGAQIQSQRQASSLLIAAKNTLFAQLHADLEAGRELNEYEVQQRFVALIEQAGMILPEDEFPIVAVNDNASNPHYEPTATMHRSLRRGDLVLFDFWARLPRPMRSGVI